MLGKVTQEVGDEYWVDYPRTTQVGQVAKNVG